MVVCVVVMANGTAQTANGTAPPAAPPAVFLVPTAPFVYLKIIFNNHVYIYSTNSWYNIPNKSHTFSLFYIFYNITKDYRIIRIAAKYHYKKYHSMK